jgi:hypothetical protein
MPWQVYCEAMTKTEKARAKLLVIVRLLKIVQGHAEALVSLHRWAAQVCEGRNFQLISMVQQLGAVQPKRARKKGEKTKTLAPEPPDLPPAIAQVEAEWQAVGRAAGIALEALADKEALPPDVDVIALRAALKGLLKAYGPEAYGHRRGLPQLKEPKSVFTGAMQGEPPARLISAVDDLRRELEQLEELAGNVETLDTRAARWRAEVRLKVWKALPREERLRKSTLQLAREVGSTSEGVRTALQEIRAEFGTHVIGRRMGRNAGFWRTA